MPDTQLAAMNKLAKVIVGKRKRRRPTLGIRADRQFRKEAGRKKSPMRQALRAKMRG